MALMERIVEGEHIAVMPCTILVEVVSAIRRRTGDGNLAGRIGRDLENIDTLYFLDVNKFRAKEASEIARTSGLRGMDALVVQAAKEHGAALVTLDTELSAAARTMIKVSSAEDVH